ncbi:MAG: ParB/RepB/Spo0J family partition protein [Bacteroidales bacterium]
MKSKKHALGRGLQAILESPQTDITSRDISGEFVVGAIAEISIQKIEPNPFQPRTEFDQKMIEELAESIKEQGIIQPITVRKLGFDQYQLISGERRLRASNHAQLTTIPAYIRVANDEQMLEMALIENIHRQNLNPIEIAISYQRLLEECNLTQEELSLKVGKNRSTVSNFIRLLKLPPNIQIALKNNDISMGHARALINIEDKNLQNKIFRLIILKKLSVRQTEEIIKNNNQQKVKKNNIEQNSQDIVYQKDLTNLFNTKVELKRSVKGNGKLVINFKSENDLERILTLLEK